MTTVEITEFTKWFATLGVGGILGAFIFWFYRKDMISNAERTKEVSREHADRLKEILGRWETQTTRWDSLTSILMTVIKENSESNTKLVTAVDALQRQLSKQ